MNYKMISLLMTILLSIGTISSVASVEFNNSVIYTDKFDILEIQSDDLNNDGSNEIIAYTAGKKLICLDDKGNVKWNVESNNSFSIVKIMDVYGESEKEIIAGTENRVISKKEIYNGLFYLLDSEGKEITVIPIVGSVLDFDIGDVDSNGTYETIIGADDGNVYLFNQELTFLWDYKTKGYNFRTLITDLNQDGKNEILVVSFDNTFILDGQGKLTNSYNTKNILRELFLDKFNNMIHVSRWYRDESQDWKGTIVYSLNRNLAPMWEFKTETDSVASALFDINNDGKEEIILGGSKGEIIVLDSKGTFIKRFDLPDRIFKIGVIKFENQPSLVLGCKDNNLYILNTNSGITEYTLSTGGWVETFFIKDLNNDGLEDILVGSDDNKIYLLTQKKVVIPSNNDTNKTETKPIEEPKSETKNTPFEEVGIIGGTIFGAIYLAFRKRK
ncbi:MAG: FG-GAP repeat protein [Candidatus Methanofastidiosum methylothiophilum]|uniref:FG-GAP repeat protein n=1 Tax=Candidatus Methanofastidiosum methylothiophilum TaxID=1705564 RepID=A0A150JBT1_9EURY|nr:MAG: FG-GAP repeat protein [Candidatus Methanofastidiosum methylthiophilus]NMC77556.1 hypothetical protein [Candidatus Methanofastidiosa archaeon]